MSEMVKTVLKNVIAGVFIGISNVIPGVSGGTIACVFGVYEQMLSLPSFDFKRIREEWHAVFSLYMGMAVGVLIFSKLVRFVYNHYPIHTAYFFAGIIFGSLFFLYDEASEKRGANFEYADKASSDEGAENASSKQKSSDACIDKHNAKHSRNKHLGKAVKVFLFVLGLALMTSLYIFKRLGIILPFSQNGVRHGLSFYFVLFIYSSIASTGMIIPGVSGSFLLVLLGAYHIVIEAVANFNIKLLLIIGIGVIFGALNCARGVRFLIERFRSFSYAFILGLTMGSVLHIFPVVCQPFTQRFVCAIVFLAGYVVVTIFTGRNVQKDIQ